MKIRLWLLLCALVAAPATAALVRPLGVDALVERASVIALGTVSASNSQWREGRVVTTVRLRVERAVKGEAADEVTLVTLGGTVDGIGQRVSGAPVFAVGEQVVVFLEPVGKAAELRVVGMAQGKLRVEPDLTGGRVVRDLSGLSFAEVDPSGAVQPAAAPVEAMPLDAFLASLVTRIHAPVAPTLAPPAAPTVAP